jgi:hypothetical protein
MQQTDKFVEEFTAAIDFEATLLRVIYIDIYHII